ncbi:type II toxin-antitoxin system VapC family toxin [bacterium]|nr:type II toxin-antitoxin system VapC family toxin [bacterium]
MILYAESSAVLTWLLDEPRGPEVNVHLRSASVVVASRLTLAECHRALVRRVVQGAMTDLEAGDLRARLGETMARWTLVEVDSVVLDRAGQGFPVEPMRTLDAVHLATALGVSLLVPALRLLSLDRRVCDCARALGFVVVP